MQEQADLGLSAASRPDTRRWTWPGHWATWLTIDGNAERLFRKERLPPGVFYVVVMKSDVTGAETATIQHTRVATGLTYDALVKAFEREVGHLDPKLTQDLVKRKASRDEVKRAIEQVGGPHGLMVIFRADQGQITSLSGLAKQRSEERR